MNNQRFTRIICANDEYTGSIYEWDEPVRIDKVCDKLNQFDKRLKDKDDLLKKQLQISQALNDELQKYDKLLDSFIENERTELGKSVLKQYKSAINGGIKTA